MSGPRGLPRGVGATYRKILVGFNNTEQGRDALALGRILAQANGVEMLIVTAPGEGGEDLAQLVRSHEADLVVLGSTHRGPIGRVVPGADLSQQRDDATGSFGVTADLLLHSLSVPELSEAQLDDLVGYWEAAN